MAELLEAWCFIFFLFFYFWFIFLFCRLLWNDFSELVSTMECDHGCSMNIFYELCESWFYEWIGAKLLGE